MCTSEVTKSIIELTVIDFELFNTGPSVLQIFNIHGTEVVAIGQQNVLKFHHRFMSLAVHGLLNSKSMKQAFAVKNAYQLFSINSDSQR